MGSGVSLAPWAPTRSLYRPPCCLAKPGMPADSWLIASSATLKFLAHRISNTTHSKFAASSHFAQVQNPGLMSMIWCNLLLSERRSWPNYRWPPIASQCTFPHRPSQEPMRKSQKVNASISTPRLNTLPCLHLVPINLIVFQGGHREI